MDLRTTENDDNENFNVFDLQSELKKMTSQNEKELIKIEKSRKKEEEEKKKEILKKREEEIKRKQFEKITYV